MTSDALRRDRRTRGDRLLAALDECAMSAEVTASDATAQRLAAACRDLAEAYAILSNVSPDLLDRVPPGEEDEDSSTP